jgi:hypothetical protein
MHAGADSMEWSCPGCGATASSAYCPGCGEARPSRKDLTLRGFLVESFHALTDIDGRLIRSFRALLFRPGELTVAYREGSRKAWLGPLQIFLIANVAFFAVQGATHDHIFSGTLDSHLQMQDWKDYARVVVAERLRNLSTTAEDYALKFDGAADRNARSLVALMTLPFMLLMPLLVPRQARGFVVRAAFTLHLYAYLMLLFCVALLVAAAEALLGGEGLRSTAVDRGITVVLLAGSVVYLYSALCRVYPAKRGVLLLRALALGVLAAAIVPGYRFVVFLITLYTTR